MPDFGLDKSALRTILGLAPSSTSNLVGDTDTQTLSNKTFNVNLNSLIQTTPAVGAILKDNGTSFVPLPRGTANQVLAVNSSGTDLVWAAAAGGGGNVSTGQANTYGDFDQIFRSGRIKLRNPANTFSYIETGSAITADRTITYPLLTGNDTYEFIAATQTVTNKTVDVLLNTLKQTTPALGAILKDNGTNFVPLARGTANQVLTVNAGGTDISWAAPAAGGGNVSTGQINTYGDFDQIFRFGRIKSRNSANTFDHAIQSLSTASRTWSLPDVSDTATGLAATQTLTNKTMSGASNTFTNIPSTALPSNVNYLDVAQTITAADTYNDQTIKLRNPGNTFSYTVVHGAITANRLLTIPALTADDTVQTLAQAQTPTNKTINATNNTITDTSTAAGDILKSDGTKFTRLARGTSGQVLTAGTSDISWAAPSGGGGTTTWNSYDYYIFIDTTDANKYKAKNGRTGVIDFTDTTNANVVLQGAIDALSTGSTYSGSTGLWSGGLYGVIRVGPGTYNFANSVVLKSRISIIGSGQYNTFFRLANGHANNNNSNVFKSSMWDSTHFQTGLTTGQRQQHDQGILLRDFSVDGNKANNTGVTTTTPTPGVESWGHGIAIYGVCNMQNIFVHDCRGAAIICQSYSYSYITDDGSGTAADGGNCYLFNIGCHWNNGHGILMRHFNSYINTYNSSRNGEAGLEYQECGFFGQSPCHMAHNMLLYLDAQNHGNQSTVTRDPTSFEIRVGRGFFISDSWLEAPWGPGDNLQVGIQGAPGTSSDFTLMGPASGEIRDCLFDALRKSAIYISNNAAYCDFHGIDISGGGGSGENSEAVGITVLNGGANSIKGCHIHDIVGTGTAPNETGRGIVMGGVGFPVQTLSMDVTAYQNACLFKWNHANNFNNCIKVRMIEPQAVAHPLFDAATGFTPDFFFNRLDIEGVGNSTSPYRCSNGGLATFSGNGSTTVFNIPHLLIGTPTIVNVNANTTDARTNPFAVTASSTNVTITYTTAPISGSSNVKFFWTARMGMP